MQSLFSGRPPGDMIMNQLFYLPKQQFDIHSQKNSPTKLMKLFKNSLGKESPVKRSLQKLKTKPLSFKKFTPYNSSGVLSEDEQDNGGGVNPTQCYPPISTQHSAMVEIISERQHLVRGILQHNSNQHSSQSLKPLAKYISFSPYTKQNSRCKTLQSIIHKQPSQCIEHKLTVTTTTNNHNNDNSQLQSQLQLVSIKKLRLPAKFRLTFSRYKQQKQHQQSSLPCALPMLQKKVSLSPMAKKKINHLSNNLQIINKHKQLELQYRSKQYLSSMPISITAVAATNSGRGSNRRVSQFVEGRAIERITNHLNSNSTSNKDTTNKFHAKNEKIRLALESFLQQTYPTTEEFTIQAKKQVTLRNQNEVKMDKSIVPVRQQHQVKKQRKTLQLKKKMSQYSPSNHATKKMRIQNKLPLDEYFKPWEYSQLVKEESGNFDYGNYFN